jgi:hypothetical protein
MRPIQAANLVDDFANPVFQAAMALIDLLIKVSGFVLGKQPLHLFVQ